MLKRQAAECPTEWIRLARNRHPAIGDKMDGPVVPPERNLHEHPFAGLSGGRKLEEESLQETG